MEATRAGSLALDASSRRLGASAKVRVKVGASLHSSVLLQPGPVGPSVESSSGEDDSDFESKDKDEAFTEEKAEEILMNFLPTMPSHYCMQELKADRLNEFLLLSSHLPGSPSPYGW